MHSQRQTSGNLALDQNNVIVIEATQRPEAQKLRVAAYCRVSSDSSDQMNSFAAQMNYYTTLISGKANWTLVDLYADAGISGTSAEKRPDFQRLLSDCRKGRIDKILVKSISRFARNTMDCLKTIRELKAIGVGVCFEEQNIDTSQMTGELLTAAFSAIAQKESESISQNIRWSYRHRMESGTFLPSSVPFGYRIMGRSLVVDEEQAKVVRRIFDSYLAGQSMEAIAASLNAESVPVKMEGHNRTWMYTAISYILSNERYTGDSLWQKTYATDTLPARQVRNHGEREQYYAEATHAPIIDKEVFRAVQELKESRNEKYGPRSRCQSSPLGRKVFCGECGSRFRKKVCRGVVYWACLGHDKDRQTCSVQQIPEAELYAAFLRMYHKLRLHGEPILKQMISNLQSVQERRMLWSLEIVELNKRISDISDQDRTLASLNKLGLVDPDIFIAQSNQLAQQLRAAKLEKEKVLGTENDDTLSKTQELLELLETMPEFLPDFDEDIFAALVDRIIVDSSSAIRFQLINGLKLRETIERSAR